MGTNYYAHWRPPGAETFTLRLHICKSHRMFNGSVFPSWQAWKTFLEHNVAGTERVTIVDEYNAEILLSEFVARVEATAPDLRRRQYDWLVRNDYPTHLDWLDDDGFSFHDGEFS